MKKKYICYIIFSILIIAFISSTIFFYNLSIKTQDNLVESIKSNNELIEESKILNEKIETLTIEINSIKTQLETVSTENNTLKTENLNLKEQINSLKTFQQKTTSTPSTTDTTTASRVAYLTFDDGPSKNTITILDELKKNNILATFFINGNYNKDIVQRIINDGHAIGNHTNSHNYKTIYASEDAFLNDFKLLEEKLLSDFGITTQLIRFPGGSNNTVSHNYGGKEIMNTLTETMTNNGYQYFDWNVTSGDADSTPATKEQIVSNVINRSKDKKNAIILMHDSSTKVATAEALPEIINGLKNLGYSFDKLSLTSPTVKFQ